MAQAGTGNRPLSPHLQIWKWGSHMTVSILHRVTGNGLAVAGLGVLLWWLGALASGAEAYATFTSWMWADWASLEWSGFGAIVGSLVKLVLKLVLIGLSWAFFTHMASGIRHFVLDIGAGYELKANRAWAILSMASGVLLTAGFWALLLLR
ncbi:MAG: succinate dehydrogenase, cytochrome b556 subunit [Novosphingobium sp.]|nr:succinate dehydrogenase, cytochrome b556 subunit [Novosphingobium sp.]